MIWWYQASALVTKGPLPAGYRPCIQLTIKLRATSEADADPKHCPLIPPIIGRVLCAFPIY
jgi:hypothetical protein